MKLCGAFVAIALTILALGCGGKGETATSADTGPESRTVSESAAAQPDTGYPVPSTPPQEEPPKKLVVKELKKGDGPVAHWGDEVTIRYVASFYETGTVFVQNWESPEDLKLNGKTYGPGLQRGIEGMRVGGQREILIPEALYFNDGTDTAYVVALDAVKPGATD